MKKRKFILHFMNNGASGYNIQYIKFLFKNQISFNEYFHFFIVKKNGDFLIDYCCDNYIFLDKQKNYLRKMVLFFELSKYADNIIFHGLFEEYSHFILFLFPSIAKKTVWVIWGGDLYNDFFDKPNLITIFRKCLKKNILVNIKGIAALLPQDYYFVKNRYNTSAMYYQTFYPLPVNFNDIDKAQLLNKSEHENKILLGNSASETNEHFEAIDHLLSIDKNTSFKVICPLSYGNDSHYALKVATYGKAKLKERFIPIFHFMGPMEYAKILVSIDVAVMNHNKQEALGNILALLYAGKKVYLKKSVSTYAWLTSIGVKIFDINEQLNDASNDFFYFSSDWGQNNKKILEKFFLDENCKKLWKNIFET